MSLSIVTCLWTKPLIDLLHRWALTSIQSRSVMHPGRTSVDWIKLLISYCAWEDGMSPSDVVEQNESQLSVLKRREREKNGKVFSLKFIRSIWKAIVGSLTVSTRVNLDKTPSRTSSIGLERDTRPLAIYHNWGRKKSKRFRWGRWIFVAASRKSCLRAPVYPVKRSVRSEMSLTSCCFRAHLHALPVVGDGDLTNNNLCLLRNMFVFACICLFFRYLFLPPSSMSWMCVSFYSLIVHLLYYSCNIRTCRSVRDLSWPLIRLFCNAISLPIFPYKTKTKKTKQNKWQRITRTYDAKDTTRRRPK